MQFTKPVEMQADCVGGLIAARAGYDLRRGAAAYKRMMTTAQGILHFVSAGSSSHPTWPERYQRLMVVAAEAESREGTITVDTIRTICSVAP